MKKLNHKKILRNLNQSTADKAFLVKFRGELNNYVLARPIERPIFLTFFTKTAIVFGSLALIIITSSSLVYASQSSLPGQLLYPVKITTEKARLAIAVTPENKKRLKLEFIDKRIEEVKIISEQKNVNKNADQALVIINEKIKEVEEENKADESAERQEESTSTAITNVLPLVTASELPHLNTA